MSDDRYQHFATLAVQGYERAILPMVLDEILLIRMDSLVHDGLALSELYVLGVSYLGPDNQARNAMLVLSRDHALDLREKLDEATGLTHPD